MTTRPAPPRHPTSTWPTVVSALILVLVFGGLVGVWVQDDPDTPLDQRVDIFLLLVLVVAVVAAAIESPLLRTSAHRRRAWPGWAGIVAGLVGRRRK